MLIIDEINRGNLSKIFGELMLLLEYRQESATLPYSGRPFSIPPNLVLLGTMNTADRSLALMDYALRRRFGFVPLAPQLDRLKRWLDEHQAVIDTHALTETIQSLNQDLEQELQSSDFAIGHSYFMRAGLSSADVRAILSYEIKPLLGEYFFERRSRAEGLLARFDSLLQ